MGCAGAQLFCFTAHKSMLRIRPTPWWGLLLLQKQGCYHFYIQISAFAVQFHSTFYTLLWDSFLHVLHVGIVIHKNRLKQSLQKIKSKQNRRGAVRITSMLQEHQGHIAAHSLSAPATISECRRHLHTSLLPHLPHSPRLAELGTSP